MCHFDGEQPPAVSQAGEGEVGQGAEYPVSVSSSLVLKAVKVLARSRHSYVSDTVSGNTVF